MSVNIFPPKNEMSPFRFISLKSSYKVFSNQTAESPTSDFDNYVWSVARVYSKSKEIQRIVT